MLIASLHKRVACSWGNWQIAVTTRDNCGYTYFAIAYSHNIHLLYQGADVEPIQSIVADEPDSSLILWCESCDWLISKEARHLMACIVRHCNQRK